MIKIIEHIDDWNTRLKWVNPHNISGLSVSNKKWVEFNDFDRTQNAHRLTNVFIQGMEGSIEVRDTPDVIVRSCLQWERKCRLPSP